MLIYEGSLGALSPDMVMVLEKGLAASCNVSCENYTAWRESYGAALAARLYQEK